MLIRNLSLTLLTVFHILTLSVYARDRFEELAQNFVLETRKIEIPDHPYAWNASIVQWRGSLLMSFREMVEAPPPELSLFSSGPSLLGLVWVDDEFKPQGKAQIINGLDPLLSRYAEDARLINIDERLYLVYNDNTESVINEWGFKMHIAEIDYDGENFIVVSTDRLIDYPIANKMRREKNWVPFCYQNQLLLSYSISPHNVFKPIVGDNRCEAFSNSFEQLYWEWGELRGGTPALIHGNHYLSFFHSVKWMTSHYSKGELIPHYFMGAYAFSLEPPFRITHISKEPIIGTGFYDGEDYDPYWHPVRVIFPCGFLFDSRYIWITYGRQDHEIWVVKLDRQGLLKSLTPVSSFYSD